MLIAGVDLGSVTVSTVLINDNGKILDSDYRFHQGQLESALKASLASFEQKVHLLARTSSTPDLLSRAQVFEDRTSAIRAAKTRHPNLGSLMLVGGEKFSMIHFDDKGNYRRLITNSSCAAGTGSFLDQQARRLGLKDSRELSEKALQNTGPPPKIASRCAVFAKTDLIHAQAEGYSLEEICDGLCLGLAKNISDTLTTDQHPLEPLLLAGGVALNQAVVRHLQEMLAARIITDEFSPLYPAYGAALSALKLKTNYPEQKLSPEAMVLNKPKQKRLYFPPLEMRLSQHPNFAGQESFVHAPGLDSLQVEVEIYKPWQGINSLKAFLGLDIGSTSTKAVLYAEGSVQAGLYTRTAGNPLAAVQAIFASLVQIAQARDLHLEIQGAAATGSGRKFVGKIIGSDLILDEITAHARAAYELNSKTDTIVEIGGQDSKFTTMRQGMVTFSQMNTVCAAGTGSFLEEQAEKLGVPLSSYSSQAQGHPAPLVSDRCTVFMERDINYYLNNGYELEEVLAAALFSVRENYLQKVATEAYIGKHICFQGATAKNKALVAAFEQKLNRPIFVSRYCHLTGALGAALLLIHEFKGRTSFRGLDLYKEDIFVRKETCNLCTNHCRLRIAQVKGEEVAYGFLCGRDYNTQKYVDQNTSGFDLFKSRQNAFQLPKGQNPSSKGSEKKQKLLGIPAGLYLFEDLFFWKTFFTELNLPFKSSEKAKDPVKQGKKLSKAEFCAPMSAFHGHAAHLAKESQLIFLPTYTQAEATPNSKEQGKKYCYYTQFSSSLISSMLKRSFQTEAITPSISPGNLAQNTRQLYKSLKPHYAQLTLLRTAAAFKKAKEHSDRAKKRLKQIFAKECNTPSPYSNNCPGLSADSKSKVDVLLLGRPYTVLAKQMNNRIPEIFASFGIKVFFQDMLPESKKIQKEIQPLLNSFHWHFSSEILKAAAYAAHAPGLYPVYITSFKCSPDSFALKYFKRILEAAEKPYLILQLDEHDSSAGYETRIEAGLRAFANHWKNFSFLKKEKSKPSPTEPEVSLGAKIMHKANPSLESSIKGKTILFPNWDPITNPLLAANLRNSGLDVRLLEEDEEKIRKSMSLNTGQCLPINIIAQEAMDYVQRHNLNPDKTVLWMARARVACNIPMYPYFLKSIFEDAGNGLERLGVYLGELSHSEISPKLTLRAYFAYLFGGLLRRLGCEIRPYELEKGLTNRTIQDSLQKMILAFENGAGLKKTLSKVLADFEKIPKKVENRPKVAIFGDLYVRDNEVFNQNLIQAIEQAGGEAITTPYSEYTKIISKAYFQKWIKQGRWLDWIKNRSLLTAIEFLESSYRRRFSPYIAKTRPEKGKEMERALAAFGLGLENEGESFENILKISHLIKQYKKIDLFVQASPAFCCPALVTEAMNREIERITGVPVLSITYDGTGSLQNDQITPYLASKF